MTDPVLDSHVAHIEQVVHQLKVDRDTWEAVALKYKTAFEAQTARLTQLQDICFATQAELENERLLHHPLQSTSSECLRARVPATDGTNDLPRDSSYGSATIYSPLRIDWDRPKRLYDECTNPLFEQVQLSVSRRNYGTALAEVDRLLRGPLSAKARTEGLLLKSNVLRASGPDELFEALAACSEALELCDRLSELESLLPRVRYQRGVLCYELRLLHEAREDFKSVSKDDLLSMDTVESRSSYDDDISRLRVAKRRSGFDENRTITRELLAHWDQGSVNKRRRTSAQLRQYAVNKAKRMSLPPKWITSRKDVHRE
ncbi:hypothetical protein IQ07DRAFT_519967 [Pyrenochaeta sp. DS3sAY3a]|nr:hypothetical protein IQ07DRAFT_519967 [Pyrenochaeta sp. DS3sAY3a]